MALGGGDTGNFMVLPSPVGASPTRQGQISWTVGPWVLSVLEAKRLGAAVCQSQEASVGFHSRKREGKGSGPWGSF